MKKFDLNQVKLNAWTGLVVAIVSFIISGYFDLSQEMMNITVGVMAGGFALSNVCFAYMFSQSSNYRHKYTRDDLATFSTMVMAQGFALGMVVAILYVVLPFNNEIVTYILWVTGGPMSVGLFGLAIFFSIFTFEAIKEKEFWHLLQGGSLTMVLLSLAIILAGLTIVEMPNRAYDYLAYFMLFSIAVAGGSILAQAGIAKLRRA